MNKQDNFDKIYLDLIEQSNDWRDSLGGKLVTGIGSLFKSGAKAGIKAGASGISSIRKSIHQAKVKKNFKDTVERITAIYNPNFADLNALLDHKDELIYIINSSKQAMPGTLSQFLDIFTNVGKQVCTLIQNNPSVLKSSNIQRLIQQPLILKTQKFKQSIEAKRTVTTQSFTLAYLDLIAQQTNSAPSGAPSGTVNKNADAAFDIFKKNNYIVDQDSLPYKLHRQYFNTELTSILALQIESNGILQNYANFIKNDKLYVSVEINNNNTKYILKSDVNPTEFQKECKTLNKSADIIKMFKECLISFYKFTDDQISRKKNLQNAKYSQYMTVISASNNAIDEIKWTGWFGSLKNVLRQAADCNLNIEDIKLLAKIYFHVALIS